TVSSYRTYGSSRPLNEGNTQDQFACRCRRCIGHGRRDWRLGYWGRATVSADDRIAAWLEEIGLGQYATVFAENAIDLDVLPDVTETDREKWGVALGHRKRILRAIAALSGAAAAAAAPAAALFLPQSEAEAPADRPFLRSRRFVDSGSQARSRGPARRDPRIPSLLRRGDHSDGRVCRPIHGRRTPRLFRLPPGARGRC